MNYRQELEDVIYREVFAYFGEENELSANIYNSVQEWMNRNELVFYQP